MHVTEWLNRLFCFFPQLAYTLAAARNAVGSHAANLTEGQDLILPLSVAALDDAVSALSVVLNFEVCQVLHVPFCIDKTIHRPKT